MPGSYDPAMNELGQLLLSKRKEKGFSQDVLAKRVEYAKQNIAAIERGRLIPADDLLERIAKELDLPYKQLLALKLIARADDEVRIWILKELQILFS